MTATDDAQRPRCLRCFRALTHCICSDLPCIANRTGIVILQHVRERFHPVGTVPFARYGLANCRVEIAYGDEDRRMTHAVELPERTALLYPSAHAVDLATLAPADRPAHLVVLDGTWPQSRRLYNHNPWLHTLPHVRFTPATPSGYRVRRPPRPEFLSTLESIVTALRVLEPETQGFDELLAAFTRMNERQVTYMARGGNARRMQRPRLRPDRRLPPELHAPRLFVVYGEMRPSDEPARTHDVLQWVGAHVDGEARFESIVCPPEGPPAADRVAHLGIAADAFEHGDSLATLQARFREFVGEDAVLAAWNQRTLDIARRHVGFAGPTVLLKAVHANLFPGKHGHLDAVAADRGLVAPPMPFAGRAAERIGLAVAVTRLLRARRGAPPGPSAGYDRGPPASPIEPR